MGGDSYNLAIETSSRIGSVCLGRGEVLLASERLAEQRRHAVELMPTIDALCRRHAVKPNDLGEVYVSVGPGSFTGLRIGLSTAKMIGWQTGAKLVAVPTLDVVAHNAPPPPESPPHLAVMLNAKRGQCYTGLYAWDGEHWRATRAPALLTPAELCACALRPLGIVGDHLPEYDWPADARLLDAALAVPRSTVVWRIGRALAAARRFVEPADLLPLYVRLPEAVEQWRQR